MIGNLLFILCHWLLSLLIRFYFGITVEGRQHLPDKGPCIIAANHNSHLDTAVVFFLLGQHKQALHALAAQDYFFDNKFINFLVTNIFHALAVDRQRFSTDFVESTRTVLANAGMLLIYPEGGRGDGTGIRRFKPGVGYLALHLDVPVVPVHISGTARAFPKGVFWPRPVNLQVRIGAALSPAPFAQEDVSNNLKIKHFTQELERQVRELGKPAHAPWALVTGASSGAGEAICFELARRGFNLLITARREEALQAVATQCRAQHGVEVLVQAGDLGTAATRTALLAHLDDSRPLRLLVNNAGIGAHSPIDMLDAVRHQTVLVLNINAVVALTDAILPQLLARGDGMILNIGSVYSVVPAPGQAVYSGSKAFIRSWSRALQRELAGTGVSLTLALPGSFKSAFHRDMGVSEKTSIVKLPASSVAAAVVAATIRRRSTVVPGLVNKVFLLVCTFLPLRVTTILMQFINSLRGLRKHQDTPPH